jgi:hypothetical protein
MWLLPIMLPSHWTTTGRCRQMRKSAQHTTGDERSWTTCPLLRI